MVPQEIIPAVDTVLIEAELTAERKLRDTNKGGNEIYVFNGRECPILMREVGRLREITFRSAGGGTGKSCDIDSYDLMEPPCRQLVVWDPDARLILGGYRFICGRDIRMDEQGRPRIATAHMFDFSDRFIRDFLPYTIELGRSFVRPEYQSSRAGAKALYALDNLWDGLGALTVLNPEVRYLFGKMTMYPAYRRECRNMILYFLHKHFPDHDHLITARTPVTIDMDLNRLAELFHDDDFKEDYKVLNATIRNLGVNIPPLINAYMSLSPSMRMFGTAINDEFGDVEESGIMLTIDEIYDSKKQRHIATYHCER